MRSFLTVVLAVVGGLLLLVGGAAAVVVGPDDTASLPAGAVPATSGVALTSHDLFPVQDLTLQVTAESAAASVFVGAAHPVDARDYVRGVASSWVRGVDRDGALTTDALAGELTAPEVDPTAATFWSGSTAGSGRQVLAVPLTGRPVSVVVVPLGGPAPTTLAFGAVVPHAFAAALALATVGALLVAGATVLRVRRPRAGTPVTATGPSSTGSTSTELTSTEPTSADPTSTVPAGTVTSRSAARRRALVLGAGVAALTACTPLPSAVEHPDEPTRLAADAAELDAALVSYGERDTAASARAAQLDTEAWADPDTDALLAVGRFDTLLDAARQQPDAPATTTYTAIDTAVPELGSYPMWFMALVDAEVDGTRRERPQLRVLERDRATAPWRSSFALSVPVDAVDLPGPGAASHPDEAQVAAGLAGLELVRQHLETGAEVAVDLGDLATFRSSALNDLGGQLTVVRAAVTPYDDPQDPTAAGGPVQVVPTADGVLVTASLSYVFDQHMETGWTVTLTDPAMAAVTGQTGERQNLRTLGVVQAVLLVPAGAQPRVVAADWSHVAPRS